MEEGIKLKVQFLLPWRGILLLNFVHYLCVFSCALNKSSILLMHLLRIFKNSYNIFAEGVHKFQKNILILYALGYWKGHLSGESS